jgi:hypothetical protein
MIGKARRRLLDVIASVYIYNEHRGYSSIDRVLEAVRARHPDADDFIAKVEKHRRDERKHYLMFRRYFEQRGYMPYEVDASCGHIDRLIRLTFGCGIDQLDTDAIAGDEAAFRKLCRIIMITEIRGMNQLDVLLEDEMIKADEALTKIFRVIRKDEPSHWAPYREWLIAHHDERPRWRELAADWLVHRSLILWKIPSLFLNPALRRRVEWLDASDAAGPRLMAAE